VDASPSPPLSLTRRRSITRMRRRRRGLLYERYRRLRASWIIMILLSFSVFFWSSGDNDDISSKWSSSQSPSWPTTTTTTPTTAYAFTIQSSNERPSSLPSVRRTSASLFTKSLSLYSSSSIPSSPSPSPSSPTTSSSATTMISPDIMSILSSSSAAAASGGDADDDNNVSPWAPGLWVLRLNFFGLDNNDNNNDDDLDSRAIRLAVSGVVLVSSNDIKIGTTKDDDNKRLFFGKRTTLSELRTLTLEECQLLLENQQFSSNPQTMSILSKQVKQQGQPFGYINQNGLQFLNIEQQQEDGNGNGRNGWAIDFPASSSSSTSYKSSSATKNGKASTLRICLEVNNNIINKTYDDKINDDKSVASSSVIERGGVTILPSNHCQLFLTANVWRETALEAGQRQILPLWNAARKAQSDLDQKLSHESGDRRLDGVDLVDTISAYGDMASLVWKRDETRSKLQEALRVYPPPPPPSTGGDSDGTDLPEGIWPGDIEWLSISDGGVDLNPIYMSPMTVNSQNPNDNNSVQLVGTWSAEPILPEGVYEEVE